MIRRKFVQENLRCFLGPRPTSCFYVEMRITSSVVIWLCRGLVVIWCTVVGGHKNETPPTFPPPTLLPPLCRVVVSPNPPPPFFHRPCEWVVVNREKGCAYGNISLYLWRVHTKLHIHPEMSFKLYCYVMVIWTIQSIQYVHSSFHGRQWYVPPYILVHCTLWLILAGRLDHWMTNKRVRTCAGGRGRRVGLFHFPAYWYKPTYLSMHMHFLLHHTKHQKLYDPIVFVVLYPLFGRMGIAFSIPHDRSRHALVDTQTNENVSNHQPASTVPGTVKK